ncbi:hypothetical protein QC761_207555 [Podospora bellae-mahoneyi]|uniref:Secreted protein n=1 Tax=Podospora bellae-mahoneyi TaxID=2093777 RepID=A0ABR0FQ81_9PEZI|nr:hypothetical protein QC761_207555 [Podospora bellae-mahoneyi]
MVPTITRLVGFLALFGAVHSAPASPDQATVSIGLEGREIVPVQWNLPININDPNGKKVAVTGTIEEAVARMEAHFPGWNESFVAQLPAVQLPSRFGFRADDDPELGNVVSTDCNIPGEAQSEYRIGQGVSYLRGLSGRASNNPGKCGRVSCSYHTAIYWCNADTVDKEVEWNAIADGAYDVCRNCEKQDDKGVYHAKGTVTFKEKFSVTVKEDWENC